MKDDHKDLIQKQSEDRRQAPRHERQSQVNFEISFIDQEQQSVKVSSTTLDISKTGLRVMISQVLPIGFITQLCIESKNQQLMLLYAEVKWCRESGDQFECGFELIDAESSDLKHWIKQVD